MTDPSTSPGDDLEHVGPVDALDGLDEAHAHALAYHPLTAGRGAIHEDLRHAAAVYAAAVDRLCPRSREHALAFTAIQESLMWANAAVAIHDPAVASTPPAV